jgi:lysosomal acid lipase/cholesteryl ester hydrolase
MFKPSHKQRVYQPDTVSHIKAWKYPVEEHVVRTSDGYHIGLQRIPHGRYQSKPSSFPVIVWHGLSTCSEMFVCSTPEDSLAFVLSDSGYDVWLANARGSKYSSKHDHLKASDKKYWEFSMDDYATMDVPAVVDYILDKTGSKHVSYVGFSQGSAQVFAALSLCEDLNHKINHVFALAPAMKPKQIKNEYIVKLLEKYGPNVIYSLFGRKAFLPIAENLKQYAPTRFNHAVVKGAMQFLLQWKLDKFGDIDRQAALFQNVFSTTSMRSIVHWFQIIDHGRFITFHDHPRSWFGLECVNPKRTSPPVAFPTKHIKTKMTLFCGTDDNLSDPEFLAKSLSEQVEFHHIEVPNIDKGI